MPKVSGSEREIREGRKTEELGARISPRRPLLDSSSWLLTRVQHLNEFLIAVEEIEGDKGHRVRI